MNPEGREINPEILNERMSDTLLQIREQLGGMFLSKNTLTAEVADEICQKIEGLEQDAERMGDRIKKEILLTLKIKFDSLHTIGIVDDSRTFERAAGNCIDLLEMVLLCTDSTVPKNKGKILAIIDEEKSRDY